MRAWLVDQFGEPETMRLADVAAPEPREGEVRIRARAAAVNFFDLLLVQGKYQAKPGFPFTPGAEVAGVVDAVGPGVEWKAGDEVVALPERGCYAEMVVCPAGRVLAKPRGMSFAEAAAMPIVFQTSWFALVDRAGLRAGEWLLVHAGASGTGMSAIQIGKSLGARVIATASTEEKLAFCRAQGADHAFNYSGPEWVEEVKRVTGGGADVIYDPVGGDIFDLSTKCIAPGGRLLVIGFTSGRIPTVAANRILLKNISIVGAIWGNWCAAHPQYVSGTHRKLTELFETNRIRPVVSREYAFEDARQALRDVANRAVMGKCVLRAQE
ncbi:MAG: NADPH:quinone oxidoreductase family protein [Bryobacteraceae bacterium]|nr:NADPH:quinone oxidoreductase family protein [Bryobacteraceae bacterium]